MESGIYIIKNLVNGKVYVGSSVNLHRRWVVHKYRLKANKHHSIKLQNSWNKYGSDAFEFITIQLCKKENLITEEQYWIDWFDSYLIGYNCTPKAANSNFGAKHSEETKKINSDLRKGKRISIKTEFKKGNIPWNKDLKWSDDIKNKMRKPKSTPNWRKGKTRFDLNQIKELNNNGISQKEIAKIINTDQGTVSRYINKYNLK